MSPPNHDLVLQDCDEALKLDAKYIKALNRRAAALEAMGRYQESLRGLAVSFLKCCIVKADIVARLYCRNYIRQISK